MKNSFVILVILAAISVGLTLILLILPAGRQEITDFERCAAAGYPVMESYPRQCAVPGGDTFTEVIPGSGESGIGTAPDEGIACTMDAKICPDGSSVGRMPPNCEFSPCPGE